MLGYLEDLCGALIAHDSVAIQRLLAHPLARSLPRQVREEAIAISRANATSLRAPIQTLRFYHQTLQLDAPGRQAHPDELGSDDSLADPAARMKPAAKPAAAPPRDVARHSPNSAGYGGVHATDHPPDHPPGHPTGRDQIELPLDAPRKAQAVAA